MPNSPEIPPFPNGPISWAIETSQFIQSGTKLWKNAISEDCHKNGPSTAGSPRNPCGARPESRRIGEPTDSAAAQAVD